MSAVNLLAWIPVERELPDADESVLVYTPDADSEPVWPGYYGMDEIDCEAKWFYADGSEAPGVTHWTAMPAGPQ